MKKSIVFLIDDSQEDIELASRTLKGCASIKEIFPFNDALAALGFIEETSVTAGTPCFILLDINMPRMSGIEFIRRIKSNDKLKDIPIVLLTATTELPDIKESMRLGVKHYIAKPIDPEEVEKIAEEVSTMFTN